MIGRAWARWRVAARIARRDARRARGRTALVAALVGLPVLLGTAGSVLIASSTPSNATYARWILGDGTVQALVAGPVGAEVEQDVRGQSTRGVASSDPVALGVFERRLGALLPDGDALARTVTGTATLEGARRHVGTAVTALPDQDLSEVFGTLEGSLPTDASGLALDRWRARDLGVGVGDRLTLEPVGMPVREVTVTGILARSASNAEVVTGPGGIASPDTVGPPAFVRPGIDPGPTTDVRWYVLGPEPVTWDDVRAVNGIGSAVTSRAVLADPPPRSADPLYGDAPATGRAPSTTAMFVAVGLLIIVEAVLIIGPAFAVAAKRSQRQLALLAAIGADRQTLRRSLVLAGLFIGVVSAAIAIPVGVAVAAAIRQGAHWWGNPLDFPDLRVDWAWPTLFALAGVLVAVLAAWFPARPASRIDVVAALGGRRAEGRPGRRLPVLGVAMVVIGVIGAFAGTASERLEVVVGSLVVFELGVVAASGALVSATARLAPSLGVSGRLALRDAARHRTRTAPAVAAVLAALAGVTAGAVYQASGQAVNARAYTPTAAVGTVMAQLPAPSADESSAAAVADGEQVLRDMLPVTAVAVVRVAAPADPADTFIEVTALTDPAQQCPLSALTRQPTAQERAQARSDPRCDASRGGSYWWSDPVTGGMTLVDDGSAVATMGLDGSPAAARALAAGRAVVSSPTLIWPDGTAHVQASVSVGAAAPATTTARVTATAVDLPSIPNRVILPPSALEDLGLSAADAGLVAATSRMPSQAEAETADAELSVRLGPAAHLAVEQGNPFTGPDLVLLVLIGAAALAAVGTTGIAVALAATDSVPDLATLAAVGAPPRLRRRFAAGQAGVIAVLGGWLGVVTGLALAWGLVEIRQSAVPDTTWALVIPWPTILAIVAVVPLSAMALGWLTTRSRLPVVRRLAS